MTDRPTPEQAIADWPTTIHPGSPRAISDHVCHAEVPDIIPALKAAGYVIVHPDDVPTHIDIANLLLESPEYRSGWKGCLDRIFGKETP